RRRRALDGAAPRRRVTEDGRDLRRRRHDRSGRYAGRSRGLAGRDDAGHPSERTAGRSMVTPTGLLSGYRVVEVSMLLNGASTSMMLADLGADVVKIESPRLGDYLRIDETRYLHQQANRNKRSVAVDLATSGGQEILRRLISTADVFVTNATGNRT